MILLTGATGTTGRETVRQLRDRGIPFRIMSRDPDRARKTLGDDLDCVAGDFADPTSLAGAFAGIERLSLLCAPVPNLADLELGAVAAAKACGIKHIVKMSAIKASANAPTIVRRWHGVVEERIAESGLDWTNLWPNAFMQNFSRFAPAIREHGEFYAPIGEARVSLVNVADVAAVTIAALTEDGHAGKTYEITGPEALSYADCAAALSDTLGKPVKFRTVSLERAREALVEAGIPPVLSEALIEIDRLFIDGFGAPVTTVVPDVTGQPSRTFADYVQDNKALFS